MLLPHDLRLACCVISGGPFAYEDQYAIVDGRGRTVQNRNACFALNPS
ncbi:hypothetical protein [Desulfonatronum sp. SC1]|nr:hypothetical protein [Desulfonatronum sp. SC1]